VGAVTPLAVANYWSEVKGTRGVAKGEIERERLEMADLAHRVNATVDVNNFAGGLWEPIR
jgi:hypothetical protein